MTSPKPKFLVIGHARHGKDTFCEILKKKYGFSFVSSSEFCCETVIFPKMQHLYPSPKECFEDRVNKRAEWYLMIKEFNADDHAKLGKLIFGKYDIYCGLRNADELIALKQAKVFDVSIWIDASQRVPQREDSSSMTITQDMADWIFENNGTLEDLEREVDFLMSWLDISPLSITR